MAPGFDPLPLPGQRLSMLSCVSLPASIDDATARARLPETYGIEIGGGLGPLKSKVWQIGLMGESSTEANVLTLLNALEQLGLQFGWGSTPGVGLQAAARVYSGGTGS